MTETVASKTNFQPFKGTFIAALAAFIIGVQSTAIYFLASKDGHGTNVAQEAALPAISQDEPHVNVAQSKVEDDTGQKPVLMDEEGLSGGGFFIGKEKVPYVIPLDKNMDITLAKETLISEMAEMPGFYVGSGKNEGYVLFDPLCPICHELYQELTQEKLSKLDLKIKFIPVNFWSKFPESTFSSLYMLGHILNGKEDLAKEYFTSIISHKNPVQHMVDDQERVTPLAVKALNKATMALIQTGQTTPTVVFRAKDTRNVVVIKGKAEYEDFVTVGALKK